MRSNLRHFTWLYIVITNPASSVDTSELAFDLVIIFLRFWSIAFCLYIRTWTAKSYPNICELNNLEVNIGHWEIDCAHTYTYRDNLH